MLTAAYSVTGRWNESTRTSTCAAPSACSPSGSSTHLADRRFGDLSDGEQKRVQIARSVMTDPELLLLDEPAASLDLGAREELLQLLGGYASAPEAPAIVMVTHHVEEIPPGFPTRCCCANGRVQAAGPDRRGHHLREPQRDLRPRARASSEQRRPLHRASRVTLVSANQSGPFCRIFYATFVRSLFAATQHIRNLKEQPMKTDIHPAVRTGRVPRPRVGRDLPHPFDGHQRQDDRAEDGKTYPVIDVEISSASHPFYTGKQRIMDSAGRVEKFNSRYKGFGA